MSVEYKNDATGTLDIDKIVVTYTEDITLNEYEDGDWTIAAGSNDDLTIANETNAVVANGDEIELTVDWADDVTGESGTEPTLAYTAANGTANSVTDGTNTAPDYGATVIIDATLPEILIITSLDSNSDGDSESMELTWSEPIIDVDFTAGALADWLVSNDSFATSDAINVFSTNHTTASVANDQYITLSFTPSNVSGTGIIRYSYTNDGGDDITDGVNVVANIASTAATD